MRCCAWRRARTSAPCWWRPRTRRRRASSGSPTTCSCTAPSVGRLRPPSCAARQSLLPIGMTQAEGDFRRGDVIAIRDGAGRELARGLANYSSSEARLLCAGRPATSKSCWATAAGRRWCTGTTWC
ncbi:MAG: PUA domain-containing protein [Ottowia sp.]